MNKNLPQLKQEGLFKKIKNWFLKVFRKEEKVENQMEDTLGMLEDEAPEKTFIENIKVENKDKILMLQRKIKEKQMEISDLTDQELDEMIELYKSQIEEKKVKLKKYRMTLFDN